MLNSNTDLGDMNAENKMIYKHNTQARRIYDVHSC